MNNQSPRPPIYFNILGLRALFTPKKYPFLILTITAFFTSLYVFFTSILFPTWFKTHVVNFHVNTFYPYFLVFSILLLVFAVILTYQSIVHDFSSLFLLTLGVYSGSLSYFLGFLNWDITVTDHTQTTFYQLQVFFSTVSLFLIYLHYELNSKTSPHPVLFGSIIFFITPLSILNLYHVITSQYPPDLRPFEYAMTGLLQVGAVTIFFIITKTGIKTSTLLFKHSPKARILGGMQLAGLYFLFFTILLELGETLLPLNFFNTPLYVIGLLFILIPYILDPNTIIFIPINVYLFGIVDEVGMTHYYNPLSPEFKSQDEFQTSQLFGGLAIAFKNFGEEIAQTKKGMDSLNFGDRSIIVEYIEPYYLILIANRSTYFLQKEMNEYLLELKQQYPQPPTNGLQIPHEVFESLNKKFFPIVSQQEK